MDSLGGCESCTHIGRASVCRLGTDRATVGSGEAGQEGHGDGSGEKRCQSGPKPQDRCVRLFGGWQLIPVDANTLLNTLQR